MLWKVFAGLTALAISGALCAPCQNQQQPFSLRISLRQSSVRLGTPIMVDVQVFNNTSTVKDITVHPGFKYADPDYTALVLDEAGNVVPETQLGARLHGHTDDLRSELGGGSHFRTTIEPGNHLDQEYDLSYLYRLRTPGTYSIQLSRKDLIGNEEIVKSNTVLLVITP